MASCDMCGSREVSEEHGPEGIHFHCDSCGFDDMVWADEYDRDDAESYIEFIRDND